MRHLTLTTSAESATQACGRVLADALAAGDVLLLSGDLGAGKTQLTKGLAEGLGVPEPVTSPTFNILLVHQGRIPLYHFDLYRLEAAEQLEDLDYYAVLEGDGVAVVEWGDRFAEAAPLNGVAVTLTIDGDNERSIGADALGPRGEALLEAWAAACSTLDGVSVTEGDR
ncbi:MAG TPA: tRNA (adenosine(37)-N6)-threonylcarbamoyltransferase complex ATPase subunit type 1 TsaE [Coriobacteriia bacterium]|nr:tRNA (adenosine(37)-N6)-threonylcarbamoyltransferase complex ATPase subunit type 1 TsaE [Coriobacteriia bacterium]